MNSFIIIVLFAFVANASAQYYGVAAPLYGHAVAAPLALGAPLYGRHAIAAPLHAAAAIHAAPAYAAPLLAGHAVQTGDYSRVSTVHGVQPGYPTLAAPLHASYAAIPAAPLHAGLIAPAYAGHTVAAPLAYGGALVAPHGLAHPAGLRLIK